MHWIQKPAQWWKLPILCEFSWNAGMRVQMSWLSSSSKRLGLIFPFGLISTIPETFPLSFFVFYYWLVLFIFDLFPGCILLVTFNWSHHSEKHTSENKCSFFSHVFFHVLALVLNGCNCITHCIFSYTVLPLLMSVKCVDHFVSVTSWSFMCGCL